MLKQNVTFVHSEGIQYTEHTKIHSRTPNEMYNYQLLLLLYLKIARRTEYLVFGHFFPTPNCNDDDVSNTRIRKCLHMKKGIFFPNFELVVSAMLTYFLKHIFKNSSKSATETILTNGARFTKECANSCQNKLRGLSTVTQSYPVSFYSNWKFQNFDFSKSYELVKWQIALQNEQK